MFDLESHRLLRGEQAQATLRLALEQISSALVYPKLPFFRPRRPSRHFLSGKSGPRIAPQFGESPVIAVVDD